ncbi:hypothetical protein CRUP_009728, partial [Coryphaenoides rupestris]
MRGVGSGHPATTQPPNHHPATQPPSHHPATQPPNHHPATQPPSHPPSHPATPTTTPSTTQPPSHPATTQPPNHHPSTTSHPNHHLHHQPPNHHPSTTQPPNHHPSTTQPPNHHPATTQPPSHHPATQPPPMQSEELIRAMLYASLVVVGVPGNAVVIWAFLLALHQERRLLPADGILLHLASANMLVVGVRCLLETLASFRLANVFGDVGCKAVIFVYRTARSLSIWLTFTLSAYQCLSVAPPGSRWASAHALAARNMGAVFLALWVVNTCMSSAAVLFSLGAATTTTTTHHNNSDNNNNNNNTPSGLGSHSINVQFCLVRFPSRLSKQANGAAQVGRDVVPMSLMALASLVILVFLYRHSRQAKGLRGGGGRGGGGGGGGREVGGADRRAAKAVVALVTLYVALYGVDNGLW